MDKETSPIYGKPQKKLTLKNHDTEFYNKEEEFQWHREVSLHTCQKLHIGRKWTYWFNAMFSDNHFTILLCLCHRKIIYAVLMVVDVIPQAYRTDTVS